MFLKCDCMEIYVINQLQLRISDFVLYSWSMFVIVATHYKQGKIEPKKPKLIDSAAKL